MKVLRYLLITANLSITLTISGQQVAVVTPLRPDGIYKAGMIGMANSGPHTNTCQYYITLADRSYLDGNYTLFGEVTRGMDVVNKITQGETLVIEVSLLKIY